MHRKAFHPRCRSWTAWVPGLLVCFFAVGTNLAADGVSGDRDKGKARSVQLRGKLVCLAEEMHRVHQADLPSQHQHIPGFRTEQGEYYTLLRTKLSEALFRDPRLKKRDLLLKGRVFDQTRILDVTLIRSLKDGKLHDLYYWCDICTIKSVVPGPCMCCQEDVVLKERAVEKPPEGDIP